MEKWGNRAPPMVRNTPYAALYRGSDKGKTVPVTIGVPGKILRKWMELRYATSAPSCT